MLFADDSLNVVEIKVLTAQEGRQDLDACYYYREVI
jgi:hypothetical protein